jgi:hypothetical protein
MLFALGFIVLFTIGGLNNHLVLPLKTTDCWELLTIILYYYREGVFKETPDVPFPLL